MPLPLARWMRMLALLRSAALYCGLPLILAPGALAIADVGGRQVEVSLWVTGTVLVLVGALLGSRSPIVSGAAFVGAAPVRGRWMAVNSPASSVPSHGTHTLGQAYAIDLVYAPDGQPDLVGGHAEAGFLPPQDFPGFGRPVLAAAGGIVVRVHDRRRDHRSRSTTVALVYFAVESFLRSLGPPSFLLGNHIVLRLDDGSHLLYAHLRRGSLRVSPGDDVVTGDWIAECGNSGNSTMPHLHIQRQDVAFVLGATGLPWAIDGVGEGEMAGFPKNGQIADFD